MESINKLTGIYSHGYGVVAKSVMRDSSLSMTTKCLYAYLCALAGKDGSCYPTQKLICRELSLTRTTLSKHVKILEERGCIKVEQAKKDGRFSHNIYSILCDAPCNDEQDTKSTDTETTGYGRLDTTNNNKINNRNKTNNTDTREESPRAKRGFGRYKNVMLTEEEYSALTAEFPDSYDSWIEQLSAYIESSGKKYSSHLATIRNWAKRERDKELENERNDRTCTRGAYMNNVTDEEFEEKWDFYIKASYDSYNENIGQG